VALVQGLRARASAAADVSDGLIADAGRIGRASGLGLELDLDRMPLSAAASAWLAAQADPLAARLALAAGGDDYEIVCAAAPDQVAALRAEAQAAGAPLTEIGRMVAGEGVRVLAGGREQAVVRAGWRHG
jgi:thiamine-monophosphate kinase